MRKTKLLWACNLSKKRNRTLGFIAMVQLKKTNSVFCLTAYKTASKNEGRKTAGKSEGLLWFYQKNEGTTLRFTSVFSYRQFSGVRFSRVRF